MKPKMIWRDTKTGERGEWAYTGQSRESMIREATGYSKHIPEMEYTLVEVETPDEEDESELEPFAR